MPVHQPHSPTALPIDTLASGFTIPWQAITRDEETARKKAASKTRYSCPGCELNAWAKPGARLVCFDCELELVAEGQD